MQNTAGGAGLCRTVRDRAERNCPSLLAVPQSLLCILCIQCILYYSTSKRSGAR